MPNIINGLGQIKVGVKPTPPPSLILDDYSGVSAAYSLRKLRNAYTGYAVRVRRSSDNASQDIGFNANGDLDTTALLSHVGAGNGFVSIWYDQSGNGKNTTQVSSNNQPQIVSNGSVLTLKNKPTMYFNGDNFLESTQTVLSTGNAQYSIFGVARPMGTSGNKCLFYIGYPSGNNGVGFNLANTYVNHYWFGNDFYTGQPFADTDSIYNIGWDGTYRYNTVNNVTQSQTATGKNTSSPTIMIGKLWWYYQSFVGNQSELIIYDANKESVKSNIWSTINTYYSTYTYDADAQAFINAASISDSTQINAITTLVIDLKTAGIWAKMKAIYPFVGGTATTHKFNLKDPRDLDVAFRLTFAGGGTHSSNGYQLNGSNSWGDTYFIPSTHWTTAGKSSFGLYSRTTSLTTGKYAMGSYENPGFTQLVLSNGTNSWAHNNTTWGGEAPAVAKTDKKGFYQSSRNNSTTTQLLAINGNVYSGNSTYTGRSPYSINIGTTNFYNKSTHVEDINVAYAYIGEDLSNTDLNNYYTAVQKYQTTLGRQI